MDRLRAIEREGFAIVPELFPRERLDCLLEEINQKAPRRSRAGLRHALRLAPVAGLARHPLLSDLACAVLGADAYPFRATLFDKSADTNWLVVRHQDTALPLRKRLEVPGWGPWSLKDGVHYAHAPAKTLSSVLALRVHLDDSNASNGPLRVLPRTHMMGVLTDGAIGKLKSRIAPVDCVAPKGSVVAMRPLAVHASSKSLTEAPRRVLHIEYAASTTIAEPLELALA